MPFMDECIRHPTPFLCQAMNRKRRSQAEARKWREFMKQRYFHLLTSYSIGDLHIRLVVENCIVNTRPE
jgi:hypothetical protein